MGRTKVKNSWSDLNYIKRKVKKKNTEKKLKKEFFQKKSLEAEALKEETAASKGKSTVVKTISIAVPGSILDNAQSPELRTYLAGQIARTACIYQVEEVIVFHDQDDTNDGSIATNYHVKQTAKSCQQLAIILQYLECPQYLRKHLFPLHKSLKYAGVLNPLDAPHHLRKNSQFQFREGVVLTEPPRAGKGSYVDVGLQKNVIIDKILEPYFRVTVRLNPETYTSSKRIYGNVVSPLTPKEETGIYWGYTVRIANSLNEIFTKCPYSEGYDLTIGTSDKGNSIDDMEDITEYKHCVIVFGGLQGLEDVLKNDNSLQLEDVSLLFDHYINTCPQQGSRIIRTEEAIMITLAELRKKLKLNNNNKIMDME